MTTPFDEVGGEERSVILILDDDMALGNAAARALTRDDYQVLTARTAHEAMWVSRHWNGPIQLLLCDLVLPDLSGREAANLLQAHRPSMKVLFMSGFHSPGSFRKDIERHAAFFLSKPFDRPGLRSAVESALGEARTFRDLPLGPEVP